MTERFDPSDGRMVLNSLQKRVDAALVETLDAHWRCLRAVPRIDGTLYFELQSPGGRRRLNWIDHDQLVFSNGPVDDKIVEIVKAVLDEVLTDDDFILLRYCNRELTSLRFDDSVVSVLLAGRLAPGRTSWFGYVFQDAFQEESTRFRLSFQGNDGPVSFEIRPALPPFDQDRLIFRNDLFALYLVEDSRKKSLRQLVVHQVERFVGFLLSRAVHSGMRLDRAALPASSSGGDTAPVSTSRWGNPLQWYQFFSDFEIERSNICSFRFIDPISWVTHGEAECRFVEPEMKCRSVLYTNVPWEQERQEGLSGSMSIFTNLNEEDAVLGGMPKLEEALNRASANPKARFVCLNNTCLPKIIGDDVTSAMARITKACSLPVLSLNTDLHSPDSAFFDLIRQARENVNESGKEGESRGLNLIGFPPNRGRREIIATLDEMSIEINVCVLPDIGIHLLENYLQGKTGVVYPYGSWVSIVDNVLSDLGIPWQVLPAPYGMKRTLQWFQAVEDAMGRSGALESLMSRLDGLLDRWNSLTREAASYALAFVVDEKSLQRLVTPARLYGFEILPLLEEMGFGLHLLVCGQDSSAEGGVEHVLEALQQPGRVTFSYFTSPEELCVLLGSKSFQAVYSEVFFDSRITDAGKAQFNLSMIEMGFEGAIRSLSRLIKVCKWSFYRKYQKYFGGG